MTPTQRTGPSIEVLKAGLLDTVQDAGRPGRAALALSRGGAMDRQALELANAMVGNAADEAGLEITGPGPELMFPCDAWIAWVGGQHRVTCRRADGTGDEKALPGQRPVFVRAGSVLRWRAATRGWRSWLAVAGGLSLPSVLNSRSAHLAAGIGPTRLSAGDRLPLSDEAPHSAQARARHILGVSDLSTHRGWPNWLMADDLPRHWPRLELPVLAGRHLSRLSTSARDALLNQAWTVSPQSNRQGLRLLGTAISDAAALPQLASEPVSFGTVQLPPGGEPVVLLCEHQTTGGYPRVLEVASAAEPLLAQAGAGCHVHLRLIGLEEADRLAAQQAQAHALRLHVIRQRYA